MAAKKTMLAQPVPFAPNLPEAEAVPTIEVPDSLDPTSSATAMWSTQFVADVSEAAAEAAGADQVPVESEAATQPAGAGQVPVESEAGTEAAGAGNGPVETEAGTDACGAGNGPVETYQDAEQGGEAQGEEAQGKQQDLAETMMQPGSQIVLAGVPGKSEEALIESMPEESEDMEVTCKKCGRSVSILQTLARSDTSRWCLSCNALQTLLRRHMSWPPEQFSKMSEDDQKNFFLMANMQKDSEQFKYTRVRDLLTKSMVKSKISETAMSVGGTYKPLSVLIKKGYLLPDDFEQTSPRLWSEALKCYTYLLPELSIHNTEISRSVEEQILKAERAIKKRKLDDSKKDEKDKEDGDFVVDLLSEVEDEDDAKSEGQIYNVGRCSNGSKGR